MGSGPPFFSYCERTSTGSSGGPDLHPRGHGDLLTLVERTTGWPVSSGLGTRSPIGWFLRVRVRVRVRLPHRMVPGFKTLKVNPGRVRQEVAAGQEINTKYCRNIKYYTDAFRTK